MGLIKKGNIHGTSDDVRVGRVMDDRKYTDREGDGAREREKSWES